MFILIRRATTSGTINRCHTTSKCVSVCQIICLLNKNTAPETSCSTCPDVLYVWCHNSKYEQNGSAKPSRPHTAPLPKRLPKIYVFRVFYNDARDNNCAVNMACVHSNAVVVCDGAVWLVASTQKSVHRKTGWSSNS